MKLLENTRFDAFSSLLSTDVADRHIEVRLESYSCKMAGSDKRLLRLISQDQGGGAPESLVPLALPEVNNNQTSGRSPYDRSGGSDNGSSLLTLTDAVSLKTLSFLIGVLNASFKPDYDFSSAKSCEFFRQPHLELVMSAVNSQLLATIGDRSSASANQLWTVIDEEISLQECEIYSYHPDFASDPFSEAVWSFNYLFYNRRLKRVVFFCCRCLLPEHNHMDDMSEERDVTCDFDLDYDFEEPTRITTGGSENSCPYPSISV